MACLYSTCLWVSPELLKHHATQTEPSSSGRLKGKVRMEAKRAKQKADSNNITKVRPKHNVAVDEFVPLAKFIASSKSPSASVPDLFVEALTRVISLRYGFRGRMDAEGMV
ncbi:hypothetical protein F5X68DRAFT_230959 [Plectosphaerella plurivora]|uniref:DUF6604 domain-containing protein n=1 Tax=Plectosphaerella plurivora TaxID=936078 RepID=A0A9P8VC93_9PEZI|nr:hypothetical protein F5X68DRAFT_230959 [Plectosphaerella plurivora]